MNHQGIADLVQTRRLIVTVGPGGVGKTTVAAALGVLAGRHGRRALVLTIDPARRLAGALGLDSDGARERGATTGAVAIDLSAVARGAPILKAGGSLRAEMLDTKSNFDALVQRIASPADSEQILNNQIYDAFSRTLARSHAYVAMERVHGALADPTVDICIVDTPPLRSALDILDAPGSLARFLDDGILKAFIGKERGVARLVGGHGGLVTKAFLGAVLGRELASDLAQFLGAFLPLRDGFVARAREVTAALHAQSTAFILVAAPDAVSLADAAYLVAGLARRSVPLSALVVSRAYIPEAMSRQPAVSESVWRVSDVAHNADEHRALNAIQALRHQVVVTNRRRKHRIDAFVREVAPSVDQVCLPTVPGGVSGLEDLAALLDGR